MKYTKAEGILPKHLLAEIQKYVQGQLIYIPNPSGQRRGWGENSGSRSYLSKRNDDIRRQYDEGTTLEQLAESFNLSYERIKTILYTKR
jgi:Mor family transcriptional regulator